MNLTPDDRALGLRAPGFWRGPGGGAEVLRVALPLILSMTSWTVMNFTDRMFLVWYSATAMAATLPAGMLHFTVLCLPLGVCSYVTTFVAQYYGARKPERIGVVVWQGVWLAIAAAPLVFATVPLATSLFRLAGHEPELARLESKYYLIVTYGAAGALLAASLSSFFTGRSATRTVMVVDSLAALTNGVLDYAWIFGHWGFPAWGLEGAAWATVVSTWLRPAMYAALMLWPVYQPYHLGAGRRYDRELLGRLLRFGLPNGIQMFLDVAGFSAFLLLVGHLGQDAMAATTLAFNVNSLAFVPMLGLGTAVMTLVGQELGRNRDDLAARSTWTGFVIALVYMGSLSAAYVLVPDWFLLGYAWKSDPGEFDRLRRLIVVLLRFVAAYSLFDAMNVIFADALKGAGDTRFIVTTSAVMSPVLVGGCWWVIVAGGGLSTCWWVITVWICVLGLIYLTRFLQGRWRAMRVIEP